jgi:hypothetical protein
MPFGGLVLGHDNAILGPTFGPEARIIGPNGQWYRAGELRFNRDGMVVTPDERVLGNHIYGLGGMGYGFDGKIYLPGDKALGQGGLFAGADGKRYGPALGPSGKLYGAGGVVLTPDSPPLPAPGYARDRFPDPPHLPAPGYAMDRSPYTPNFPTPGFQLPYQPTFPTPGYTPNLPFVGYEAPPAVAKPVRFGVNPYVRSPRDFFMWGDMVDEQKRRERRPGLVQ